MEVSGSLVSCLGILEIAQPIPRTPVRKNVTPSADDDVDETTTLLQFRLDLPGAFFLSLKVSRRKARGQIDSKKQWPPFLTSTQRWANRDMAGHSQG